MLLALSSFVLVRIVYTGARRNDHVLIAVLFVSALLRVFVGVVNREFGPLPGAEVDAVVYDQYAQYVAHVFRADGRFVFLTGRMGYSSLLGVFYILGGYHYLIPTLVNVAYTTEFLILVYGLGRFWGDVAVARATVTLSAFYPTSVIYTSVALREAPLLWGLALYIMGLVNYYEGRARLVNWRVILGLAQMVWLHDGFALALLLIPVASWFRHGRRPVWLRGAVILGAMVVVGVAFWQAAALFQKLPSNPLELMDPQFLVQIRERKTSYGVGYGEIEPTWWGIVKAVPLLVFAFIAAPFPAWVHGAGVLPKVIEGIYSLGLSVWASLATWRLRQSPDGKRAALLFWMFVFLVGIFAMGTGNTGIAARHRAKFVWMPMLLISLSRPWRAAESQAISRPNGFWMWLTGHAVSEGGA